MPHPTEPPQNDTLHLSHLSLSLPIAHDAFGRRSLRPQPILLSLSLSLARPITRSARSDNLHAGPTINYGNLSKRVVAAAEAAVRREGWMGLGDFVRAVLEGDELVSAWLSAGVDRLVERWTVEVEVVKGLLSGRGVVFGVSSSSLATSEQMIQTQTLTLREITIPSLIGLNPHERTAKQPLIVTVTFTSVIDERLLAGVSRCERAITHYVGEESSFGTLEALVEGLAGRLVRFVRDEEFVGGGEEAEERAKEEREGRRKKFAAEGVRVHVLKPMAVPAALTGPAIEIFRAVDGEMDEGR